MSSEDRFSVERVQDRLWVVVDRARQRAPIGRAADEAGARMILSLLSRLRASSRTAGLGASAQAA